MKVIALAAALAGAAAPAFAGDHKAQIQGYADAWLAAYNNHDVVSLAKMYTDDAEMSWPTATASGKAAILETLKKDFAANAMKFNIIATEKGSTHRRHLDLTRDLGGHRAGGGRQGAASRRALVGGRQVSR